MGNLQDGGSILQKVTRLTYSLHLATRRPIPERRPSIARRYNFEYTRMFQRILFV